MREVPICFNGHSVWMIKAGMKTQTRRPVGNLVVEDRGTIVVYSGRSHIAGYSGREPGEFPFSAVEEYAPYRVGDQLWVREAYRLPAYYDSQPSPKGVWVENMAEIPVLYEATATVRGPKPPSVVAPFGKLRPSIHMPKWASRIRLEVLRVWAEQLRDISADDVCEEGCEVSSFPESWDAIYAKRGYGWDMNPWVYAFEFEEMSGTRD